MVFLSPNLGKYYLEDMIAVGGMARTFRAYPTDDPSRKVCIKLLHKELGENDDFMRMFIDEANIAADLHHPHIVRVFERGTFEDQHYIAMELVEGKDLKQVFDHSKRLNTCLTPLLSAIIARDMCGALDYVHNKTRNGKRLNIIHRDVSPHNIIVNWEGQSKLTDFGIAKAAQRLTHTQAGAVKGKYGYMSPEQARGKSIDARSDIFSVGIVLHEMLTSKPLFDAESSFEAFAMVLEHPILPPSQTNPLVDPELDRICMKALERDLPNRYAAMRLMHDDLRRWVHTHHPERTNAPLGHFMRVLFGHEEGTLPTLQHNHAAEHNNDARTHIFHEETPFLSDDDGGFAGEATVVHPLDSPGSSGPFHAHVEVETETTQQVDVPPEISQSAHALTPPQHDAFGEHLDVDTQDDALPTVQELPASQHPEHNPSPPQNPTPPQDTNAPIVASVKYQPPETSLNFPQVNPPQPPNHTNKRTAALIIAGIVALLLLSISIGLLAFLILKDDKKTQTPPPTASQTQPEPTPQPTPEDPPQDNTNTPPKDEPKALSNSTKDSPPQEPPPTEDPDTEHPPPSEDPPKDAATAQREKELAEQREKARKEREKNTGLIVFRSKPWANISINGRKLGRTPRSYRGKPGKYTILFQNPQLKRAKIKTVTIKKGQKLVVTHNFK